MPKDPMRDVIVLLPGITGSRLRKDGKTVWGFSGGTIGRSLLTRGGHLRDALTLQSDDADDGVTADALLPDLHLLPGFWKIDGYSAVSKAIQERFDVTEGQNFFPFPYDWRRDNRIAARALHDRALDWLRTWRQTSGHADARLVLVAHSMGGLVSRYFLEVLGGWQHTRALVTFGTPYRGSVNAVDTLANGMKRGPFGLIDLSSLGRSFTAIYQLLPTYRCYDPGDGTFRRLTEVTSIPNLDPAKVVAARAFHQEIEDAVASNANEPGYGDPDRGYRAYPFVGVSQVTSQGARRVGGEVEMLTHGHDGVDRRGDGTVPRVASVPQEWADASRATFSSSKHGSMQNTDDAHTGLVGILTGQTLDLGDFLAPGEHAPAEIALETGDLYLDDEPVEVRAQVRAADGVPVVARLEGPGGTHAPVEMTRVEDDTYAASFGPLPEGAYSATVSGGGAASPAVEAFAVADLSQTAETDA